MFNRSPSSHLRFDDGQSPKCLCFVQARHRHLGSLPAQKYGKVVVFYTLPLFVPFQYLIPAAYPEKKCVCNAVITEHSALFPGKMSPHAPPEIFRVFHFP